MVSKFWKKKLLSCSAGGSSYDIIWISHQIESRRSVLVRGAPGVLYLRGGWWLNSYGIWPSRRVMGTLRYWSIRFLTCDVRPWDHHKISIDFLLNARNWKIVVYPVGHTSSANVHMSNYGKHDLLMSGEDSSWSFVIYVFMALASKNNHTKGKTHSSEEGRSDFIILKQGRALQYYHRRRSFFFRTDVRSDSQQFSRIGSSIYLYLTI